MIGGPCEGKPSLAIESSTPSFRRSRIARAAVCSRVAEGPATIGELAAPLPMTLPAVSKHLRVLERAGLVKHCEMDARPMQDAAEFIARYRPFWTDALERLAAYAGASASSRAATRPRSS